MTRLYVLAVACCVPWVDWRLMRWYSAWPKIRTREVLRRISQLRAATHSLKWRPGMRRWNVTIARSKMRCVELYTRVDIVHLKQQKTLLTMLRYL